MSEIAKAEQDYQALLAEVEAKQQQAKAAKRKLDELRADAARSQQPAPKPPSTVRRVANFARALARWEQAGKPVRTNEQVETLRQICTSNECGLFDGTVCTHWSCGCPVSRPGRFGDKLRWSTESCPVGKW